jgi:ATP-dependent RNA helicase DDX10/DBP4
MGLQTAAAQVGQLLSPPQVGRNHEFSAGLLIGGKKVKEEKAVVNHMNILVATPGIGIISCMANNEDFGVPSEGVMFPCLPPGRLLQHMDETPGFDATNLQVDHTVLKPKGLVL